MKQDVRKGELVQIQTEIRDFDILVTIGGVLGDQRIPERKRVIALEFVHTSVAGEFHRKLNRIVQLDNPGSVEDSACYMDWGAEGMEREQLVPRKIQFIFKCLNLAGNLKKLF